jgi:hypothetical protein
MKVTYQHTDEGIVFAEVISRQPVEGNNMFYSDAPIAALGKGFDPVQREVFEVLKEGRAYSIENGKAKEDTAKPRTLKGVIKRLKDVKPVIKPQPKEIIENVET